MNLLEAHPIHQNAPVNVGIQHGAGYVGRELIKLVLQHPTFDLKAVGSSSMAGSPIVTAHPVLASTTDLVFIESVVEDPADLDVIVMCAAHGEGACQVDELLHNGFDGIIVDMSSDLRSASPEFFEKRFGRPHPALELLDQAVYGLPEIITVAQGTKLITNPGCFATAIALALHPLSTFGIIDNVAVTAMTGASGSGSRPGATTHFPDRDGNMRAYSVLNHQHAAEVEECLGGAVPFSFVPVSGPWTRGIWGTAQVSLPADISESEVTAAFEKAYEECPFVRLHVGGMPELNYCVGTPFCDIGIVMKGNQLVIGFALDNLLKGAASQAIQNINCALGLDERTGLIGSLAGVAVAGEVAVMS